MCCTTDASMSCEFFRLKSETDARNRRHLLHVCYPVKLSLLEPDFEQGKQNYKRRNHVGKQFVLLELMQLLGYKFQYN